MNPGVGNVQLPQVGKFGFPLTLPALVRPPLQPFLASGRQPEPQGPDPFAGFGAPLVPPGPGAESGYDPLTPEPGQAVHRGLVGDVKLPGHILEGDGPAFPGPGSEQPEDPRCGSHDRDERRG